MRAIHRIIFKYPELQEGAKIAARQRYGSFDAVDSEQLEEDFLQQLEQKGYVNAYDLQFSLNYCPGDGVSFCGEYTGEELRSLLQRVLSGHIPESYLEIIPNLVISITRHNLRYTHELTCSTEWVLDYPLGAEPANLAGLEERARRLRDCIEADRQETCKELAAAGYEEIEYRESDSFFAETCDANAWEFYADGTLYREEDF